MSKCAKKQHEVKIISFHFINSELKQNRERDKSLNIYKLREAIRILIITSLKRFLGKFKLVKNSVNLRSGWSESEKFEMGN